MIKFFIIKGENYMGKNKRTRSHTKHVFVQKKYRDALFRRIFNEKPVLLELYNALNQTDQMRQRRSTEMDQSRR